MRAPVYSEYAPAAELADFVQCLWTFSAANDPTPQRIAPDGRPEMIVHLRKPYMERRASGDVAQAPVLFAGQLTAPLTLVAQSDVSVVGVRFHAHAARAFLGADAEAATDLRLDLAALHGGAAEKLRREMREEPSADRHLDRVQEYVLQRVEGMNVDRDVRAVVDTMFDGGEAARPAHIAERQWQRRFKSEVGVSARMLQTLLRFRRLFDAIERDESAGWVEAALAAGYFDQPQMARDFRRFLGVTAREWAQQKAGLAKALTESYKTAS